MFKKIVCDLKCGLPVAYDPAKIIVHGAREHNLKNICFEVPRGKLVALTGPSGSGKSSIATDILQKECVRQFLESLGMTTDHIAKANVDSIIGLSPSIGVSQRSADFNPRSTVGTKTGILTILRNMFAAMGHQPCVSCGKSVRQPLQDKRTLTTIQTEEETTRSSKKVQRSYFDCSHCGQQLEKLKMAHFSCNTVVGACEVCKGMGQITDVDLSRLLDEEKTLRTGGVALWNEATAKHYESVIIAASKHYNFSFDPEKQLKEYTQEQRNFLLYGINFPDFIKTYKNIKPPKKVSEGNFEGIIPNLLDFYKKNPEKAPKYITHKPCVECKNTGLAKLGRKVTVGEKTIINLMELNLRELLEWLHNLDSLISENEVPVFTAFSHALKERIANLIEIGLDYLALGRTIPSLSGGESQRVRLAGLLGSGLSGVLYVLDEPTTGLHSHDTAKLLKMLRMLQQAGNTVLVIEHDRDVIKKVDYVLDIGPGGGSNGGEIIATGTPTDIMACPTSITGKYLAGKLTINFTNLLASENKFLTIRGASEHNLKNIDVSIPIGQLVALTGVSGSGKSTFLFDIVDKVARNYLNNTSETPGKHASVAGLEYFNRVVTVDQAAIGTSKSSRSNVATYTKLFDAIRDLFASLPAAKARGFGAEKFSFNSSDMRCENCNGSDVVEVDMTFMSNIEIECPVCNGMRFNEELLAVHFQGHTIANILDMTIGEALHVFKQEKKIFVLLDVMKQVGLDYLKIGQSTSTLSGGEAQRIKLASELAKAQTGNTLYLLDEPTTGLHPQEVERLVDILKKLVLNGNTVVVIEHNLELIGKADTIIDFGPGGGLAGGTIVATGTPEQLAANNDSLTGKCLRDYLASSY